MTSQREQGPCLRERIRTEMAKSSWEEESRQRFDDHECFETHRLSQKYGSWLCSGRMGKAQLLWWCLGGGIVAGFPRWRRKNE